MFSSCAVQLVELDGFHYMDGSLADSIPVKRAFEVDVTGLSVF